MIHEDDRRTLEDWPEAKIITAKMDDCILGDHYHKVKTEKFILVSGLGMIKLDGVKDDLVQGQMITIEPGVRHSFCLHKGSVLIGLCSHVYDPTDDYK